jgi:hypothetical protein
LTDTGSGFWARFGPRSSTDVDFSLAHFNTLPPGDPSLARSSSVVEETLEERTLESLRRLRAHLQERQDVLYDDEQRSHDEMAAVDAEWEELREAARKGADLFPESVTREARKAAGGGEEGRERLAIITMGWGGEIFGSNE